MSLFDSFLSHVVIVSCVGGGGIYRVIRGLFVEDVLDKKIILLNLFWLPGNCVWRVKTWSRRLCLICVLLVLHMCYTNTEALSVRFSVMVISIHHSSSFHGSTAWCPHLDDCWWLNKHSVTWHQAKAVNSAVLQPRCQQVSAQCFSQDFLFHCCRHKLFKAALTITNWPVDSTLSS